MWTFSRAKTQHVANITYYNVLSTINPYIGRQVFAIFLRGISYNAPDITIYKAKYIISIWLWASSRDVRNPKKYAISQGSTYKIDAKMCTLHKTPSRKSVRQRDTEVLEAYFPHTKQNSGNWCSSVLFLWNSTTLWPLPSIRLCFNDSLLWLLGSMIVCSQEEEKGSKEREVLYWNQTFNFNNRKLIIQLT